MAANPRVTSNYAPPEPDKKAPGYTRPLSGALQQVWVFRFFDPGPGGSGGPREAPQSHPWAFPGPPGASRRPPGPKTNPSKKPKNLKELTEQWRSELEKTILVPNAVLHVLGPGLKAISIGTLKSRKVDFGAEFNEEFAEIN